MGSHWELTYLFKSYLGSVADALFDLVGVILCNSTVLDPHLGCLAARFLNNEIQRLDLSLGGRMSVARRPTWHSRICVSPSVIIPSTFLVCRFYHRAAGKENTDCFCSPGKNVWLQSVSARVPLLFSAPQFRWVDGKDQLSWSVVASGT